MELPSELLSWSSGYRFDPPNPELTAAVLDSLTCLEGLLERCRRDTGNFDGAVLWALGLQKWRSDLFLAAGYMAAAGYDVPWDLELEPSPTDFIERWRDLLVKVWSVVDPTRPDRLYKVQ